MNEVRNFTILERTSEPEKDNYGNWTYFVKLEGVEKGALLVHKKGEPKNPGDVIEGYYLEEKKSQAGKTYLKLTRPQQQSNNGGGGNRAKDPAERESIERQVAAKVASDLLVALMAQGTFKPEGVDALGDAHTRLAAKVAGGIRA